MVGLLLIFKLMSEQFFLNKEQLELVERKAKFSMLNNPGFISQIYQTKSPFNIAHITARKKLILIEGDEETGTAHFLSRHRPFTNTFTQISDGFIRTSRFPTDKGGLFDLMPIMEFVYDENHLQTKQNKYPDFVEVYDAKIPSLDNQKYRLIVYKGTKIVHTFFPVERNKPVRLFQKLNAQIEYQDSEIIRLVIPYINTENIVVFAIAVLLKLQEGKEEFRVLFYKEKAAETYIKIAEAFIKEIEVKYQFNIEIRIEQLNHYDFTQWEDKIIEHINNNNELKDILKK